MRIKKYLIHIKKYYHFKALLQDIDRMQQHREQLRLEVGEGFVIEMYSKPEMKEISEELGLKLFCSEIKSIVGFFKINQYQEFAIKFLIDNKQKYNDIYEFLTEDSLQKLSTKHSILNKDELKIYGEKYSLINPETVEIKGQAVECYNCTNDFEVLGDPKELDEKIVQCPICKKVLAINVEYEPVLTTITA